MKIRQLTKASPLAVVPAISLSAWGCSGGDRQREGTREMTPQASTPGERGQRAARGRSIRIRVGDARLTARLDDNAPANDLAAQLPLTLTFRDHNSVEKTAPLSRELSLEGVPRRPRSGRRRHRLLGPRWSAGSLLRR